MLSIATKLRLTPRSNRYAGDGRDGGRLHPARGNELRRARNLRRGWQRTRASGAREPSKLPVVLSADEVVRFLEAIPSLKAALR